MTSTKISSSLAKILKSPPSNPVGLFDSGFGGLSVMREIVQILPKENLIYLGDTAHLPYGNKSSQTILQLALENASFLMEKQIKLLVIPCHTACSHALQILQNELPIPVIGVIESGLELLTKTSRIAILATASTIESGIYQVEIQKQNPHAQIYPISCPLFVPLVEEGFHAHPSAHLIAKAYLDPLKGQIDTALLACTHYPLLRPVIQSVLGPEIALIEPARRCAEKIYEALSKAHLLNPQTKKPHYEFYATDDPEKFRRLGNVFFGSAIKKVEKK